MGDRRRAPRYVLRAVTGQAASIVEVVLMRVSGRQLTVISSREAAAGDELMIHFRAGDGESAIHEVRVESSTPVMWEGHPQFRLELRLHDRSETAAPDGNEAA